MTSDQQAQPHLGTGARDDLVAVLQRGLPIDSAFRATNRERNFRRSAVLMLFGARSAAGPDDLGVLLTRRALDLRHHAGQIAFPGGGLEPMDSGPEAAALRETSEETGVDARTVEVLGRLPDVALAVSGNVVTPVIGWWHSPGPLIADLRETAAAQWVAVADLLNPASRGTSVLTFDGAVHRGPAFQLAPELGGQIVWGFTGTLLAALFDEAGWTVPWDRTKEIVVAR